MSPDLRWIVETEMLNLTISGDDIEILERSLAAFLTNNLEDN